MANSLRISVFVFLLIQSTWTSPIDPNSEVELVEPVRTGTSDNVGSDAAVGTVPVLVISTGGNGWWPFRSFFGSDYDYDSDIGDNDGFFDFPSFSTKTAVEDTGEDVDVTSCSFICSMFKSFQDQLRQLDEETKKLRGISKDNTNSTYTEKILPDGTVVKINRTVASDTDENGNTFFFHSTVLRTKGVDGEENTEGDDVGKGKESVNEFEKPDEPTEVDDSENEVPTEKLVRPERSPEDYFQQQQESYKRLRLDDPKLNEIDNPPRYPVRSTVIRRVIPRSNIPVIRFVHDRRRARPLPPPPPPHPSSYTHDTRVNALISVNAKRGGLVRMEPHSELIVENEDGVVVPLDRSESLTDPWQQQKEH